MPTATTATPRSSPRRWRAASTATPTARRTRARGGWPGRCRPSAPRRPTGSGPRLERLPALRALLRDLGHRRDHQHDQPAALCRADRLHLEPRREPGALFRRDVHSARREARAAAEHRAALRPAHRPRAHAEGVEVPLLRRAAGREERRLPVALVRRAHRRRALLYLGDDGEPERRALPAPQHRHPCLRRCAARRARPVCARLRHAGGADVPRQCLEPALRVHAGRDEDGVSRAAPRRQERLRPDGSRARHDVGRGADGLAHAAATSRREQIALQQPQAHRDRRLGLPRR